MESNRVWEIRLMNSGIKWKVLVSGNRMSVHVPFTELNDFFISCGQTVSSNRYYHSISRNLLINIPSYPEFNFKTVIAFNVIIAIRWIKINAMGSDNTPIRLLENILFSVLSTITLIYNNSYRQGVFPHRRKSAHAHHLRSTSLSPLVRQAY